MVPGMPLEPALCRRLGVCLQADMRRLRNMMDSGRREDGSSGPALDQPASIDVGEACLGQQSAVC